MASYQLDCRGLKCPMPIVRISVVAKAMRPGDEIKVEADDPAFRPDLQVWARHANFTVAVFEDGVTKSATLVKR